MSEGAKVCHVDEAIAIISSMQKKNELREKKGSVKLWELDSNSGNGGRDSCTVGPPCFLLFVFLHPTT